MKKIDLIKSILEIGKGLEDKSGFDAVATIEKMELLIDKYIDEYISSYTAKSSREVKQFMCNHTWKMVGHQLNGHEECTKCRFIGKTYG